MEWNKVDGEDEPPKPLTLAEACDELIQALKRHQTGYLHRRGEDLRHKRAIATNNLREARAKKTSVGSSQESLSARLQHLDQPALERIPDDTIEGQTNFIQLSSYLFLWPTFRVSVKTKHKILERKLHQSDGVTWDPVVGPVRDLWHNTYQLTTTAHLPRFITSTAEIILYGQRNEIYRDEILELGMSLIRLQVAENNLQNATDALAEADRVKEALEQETQGCRREIDRISALAKSATIPPPAQQTYLDAGDLPGFAATEPLSLGNLQVENIYLHPNTSTTDKTTHDGYKILLAAMAAARGTVKSAQDKLETYWDVLTQPLRGPVGEQSGMDIDEAIRGVLAGDVGKISGDVKRGVLPSIVSPVGCGDTEVLMLMSECQNDLDELVGDVVRECGVYGEGLEKLSATSGQESEGDGVTAESTSGSSSTSDTTDEDWSLEEIREAVGGEKVVLDRICELMTANKQPVGVAASMQSKRYSDRPEGLVDAFLLLYKSACVDED